MSDWTLAVLDDFARTTGLQVDRGVRARHFASSDWGGLLFGKPAAVVRPNDSDGVVAAVGYANEHGLRLTPRATGASSGGQSVADGSVTLDLTGLHDVVVDPSAATVTCGPGATWRSVLIAALEHDVQPHVMPLQLDLTVGGVLSVGGFGAVGHRFGIAASHATELEVVTGDGRRSTCNGGANSDLLDAVRGGLGRCGVITSATLALRPAPQRVRAFRWQSSTTAAWTDALLSFAEAGVSGASAPVAHVEGFCRTEGDALVCEMQVGIESDDTIEPPPELAADPGAVELVNDERPLIDYLARLDPRFEEMVAVGYVDRAHPWIEALLTPQAFVEVLPEIMAGIAGDAGDRIQVVLVRTDLLPPYVVAPPGPMAVCVVIVPRGIPRDVLDTAKDAMARVNQLILAAGGKRYLAGWLPEVDEGAWQRHFGDRTDAWLAARRTHDPNGTFTSALFATLDAR